MSSETFSRDERDDLRLVVPLEGPTKFSNLLLNRTASHVLDDLAREVQQRVGIDSGHRRRDHFNFTFWKGPLESLL